MSAAVVVNRVAASAACRAGCSGRGVDVDAGRRSRHPAALGWAGVDRRGKSVASWTTPHDKRHASFGSSASRRARVAAAASASGAPGANTGRGSQQSVRSTLVPEPEVANSAVATQTKDKPAEEIAVREDEAASIARRVLPSGLEVVVATEAEEFEVAAELRAVAFYEDLEARQALPFPPRFVATFRREFAQRERRALRERTNRPSGPSRRCLCLMAKIPDKGLVGCLDVSVRDGPCCSQVNGACVGDGEEYVYIDNVAVDAGARRRGSASAMLEASSDVAASWGAGFIYTHVHADNVAARRLYHAYVFRAPNGTPISEALSPGAGAAWMSSRLQGLVLLRAPLPLMQAASEKAAAAVGDCTCGAKYEDCDECICKPGGVR
jgi:ribosomal protein S18 acetylase RimI-like enzyme